MEIQNKPKRCIRLDATEAPVIELIRVAKGNGSNGKLYLRTNEILFVMEGHVQFIFSNFPDYEAVKGQILFFPAGGNYSYRGLSYATLLVFRIGRQVQLCDSFLIDKLYASRQKVDSHKPHAPNFSRLEINNRMWAFLNGLSNCIADGVRCRGYFDLKIKEFFFLLRLYYREVDIYNFLYLVLSCDTAFSEYVRQNWHRYHTVNEIAAAMHRSTRQFSVKFKQVFGMPPYKWMKEGKAKNVLRQLQKTDVAIKQVAIENGFSTAPQFSKFCKSEFGKTPTELREMAAR